MAAQPNKRLASGLVWEYVSRRPILYGLMGFLFGMLAAWIYNMVAKWTGGIEFEVE